MRAASLNAVTVHSSRRAVVTIGVIAVASILALQLPWISRPPFDAHSFRQAQTLSTIELFAFEGIDLAHAKANYAGEPGVFVLELPLFQALCSLCYGWFGPHTFIVRLLNLCFTFANAALTYGIARRVVGRDAALAAALIYLFAPLNLVYMGSTLIDPSAIFCSLLVFLCAARIVSPREDEPAVTLKGWAALILICVTTALVKPLYLFPTCMLLAAVVVKSRKISGTVVKVGACVVLAVAIFFIWLRHSQQINNASFFTRGISATTVLGVRMLASLDFYEEVARRVLLHLAGPVGSLLAVWAIICAVKRSNREMAFWVMLLAGIVGGYFIAFSTANRHDYYSLVVSPYASVLAAFGAAKLCELRFINLGWLSARTLFVGVIAAAISTATFLKKPRLAPNGRMLELQELSKGRFERWSFGMVFIAPDPRLPMPGNIGAHVPDALYATGLRGTGRLVTNSASALAIWREQRPFYRHLKYVVFYGLRPPTEIAQSCREILADDPTREWFACRVE